MAQDYIPEGTGAQPLRVIGIQLENIGIFEQYEIRPGDITLIEGDNEVGKTTIEQALKAVFDGGNPSRLIRNGEQTGRIVMELSNGSTFEKTLKRDGKAELKERHTEFGIISAAQTHLGRLSDGFAVDPSKLLTGEPEKRVQYFQSKLPIPLPKELDAIVPKGMPFNREGHTLTVLQTVRKQLEEARKAKGIIKREKLATVENLRKTIPPGEPIDIAQEIQHKRGDLSAAERKLTEIEGSIKSQQDKKLKLVLAGIDEEIAEGDKKLADEIERLRMAWQKEKERLAAGKTSNSQLSFTQTSDLLEQATREIRPTIEKLQGEIASLESKRDDQVRIEAQRDMLNQTVAEADRAEAAWKDYDDRVKQLDTLTESLTAELPIKGLTMQDGDLAFDGMPWGQLNTAKKVMLVFRIAEHSAGQLGFIFFDGLECLSAKTLELFRQEAIRSGRQIMVTRVTDGPLKIGPLQATPTGTTFPGASPQPRASQTPTSRKFKSTTPTP